MRGSVPVLLVTAALAVGACSFHDSSEAKGRPVTASGSGATRSFAATGFDTVELRGSDDVSVHVGPAFAVTATGDPKLLDQLDIRTDGHTLRVGRKPGMHWEVNAKPIRIDVSMPAIAAVAVNGSGDLRVDRATGDSFAANNAGSGSITLGGLQVHRAKFALSGSGDLSAAGQAQTLAIDVAGSGDVDAGALQAGRADVSIAGSGNVRADVRGPAAVAIMGSGDAELGSQAHCTVSKMGSGEARCGG